MTFFTVDGITSLYVNITQGNETNPTTANVTLNKELDRESLVGGIELKFYLADNRGNVIFKSVLLYILDTCDEPPQFDQLSYTLEIDEVNITEETLVNNDSKIHATDKDNGINAIVTYRMEPRVESEDLMAIYKATFRIDPTTGELYLLKNLDYEYRSFYQFTIHAQDSCNFTANPVNLTINVKDVQDKPPFFIGLPYMTTIREGNYNNSHVLRVEAFDGDVGIPNEIKYSFVNISECSEDNHAACIFCRNIFTINVLTGNITVTGNLDWETNDVLNIYGVCSIAVEAEEIAGPNVTLSGGTKSITNVIVTIQDENNHAPKFTNKIFRATIQENANTNTPVLLDGSATGIEVADKDQGHNSKLSVTLECENEMDCVTFALVPSKPMFRDGLVSIRVNNNSRLNYEERQNITITITAKEEKIPSHRDTATVIFTIENVNEFSPKFEHEIYEARIEEMALQGTAVINIAATDDDADTFGKITYSVAGGSNLFSVNSETGQVFTKCQPWQLDREHTSQIHLTIIAKDGGGRMNQAQLIVILDDVNDNLPVFQQEIYSAFLEENWNGYNNIPFLTIKATDADKNGTENSEISYSFGTTSWKSNFGINVTTGEIRLIFPLDYETLDNTCYGVINLTVFAYDSGTPPKFGNATVTISVQDVNDNAPKFSMKKYSGTIRENAKSGTHVGMVSATDADIIERNNKISFAIETGGLDKFRINSTTGNITVQVGAHFDRDDIKLYNLTIIAIDQGANTFTDTTTMNVIIKDVNNKPPVFNQINYSLTMLENMAVGSFLTNCIAKDPDETPSLSYNISGIVGWNQSGGNVDQSLLQSSIGIYEANGTLYVKKGLDRETVAKLEITIFVNDTEAEDNKPQIATATVTITVLDVDDNPPRFKESGDLRVGMKSSMELDKEIFELKSYITDEDSPHNAIDKWSFEKVRFQMTSELENKLSRQRKGYRCDDPICITRNGAIVNNMYYSEDMSGFFNFTVLVKDDAGNDMASILIFLVTDLQILKMTIYRSLTEASLIKDQILSDCSHVTGLLFVYDSIKGHKDNDGTIDTFRTDLFFHIQDLENNRVLLAEEAKRLFDENADELYYTRMRHSIVSIESSLKYEIPEDELNIPIYVMAAVIALLTFIVLIGGYVFFSSSRRYKRKLRAAMSRETSINIPKKDDFTVPGSNMYADNQHSIKKKNDDPETSNKDGLEEREVTPEIDGDDYYTIILTDDPLEAPLRQQDAQKQASMQTLDDSRINHNKSEYEEEAMISGIINNGYLTVRNFGNINN
ncbi:hypothetical protein CHS0354_028042 [Potamilus streckersoni]|uniref:Cadherin domain-containing protein n=1 Tax=Potamilus streckersoni TaxID=2493646 RepID=A0AAE0THY5_9BIVA|nr:hypothetical protein CHS0354_028042 [Potamilus streckersoni]